MLFDRNIFGFLLFFKPNSLENYEKNRFVDSKNTGIVSKVTKFGTSSEFYQSEKDHFYLQNV
jgi:hypothetical protein